MPKSKTLKFIANARLKDVVGRELINDDNVAIIELIKNSKDAGSKKVKIRFGNMPSEDEDVSILIQDFGKGMSLEDIQYKWLNIAYSEKKSADPSKRKTFAGNKGIGRFSCDRLGKLLVLYTRTQSGVLYRLEIDWTEFEVDDREKEIGKIRTTISEISEETLKEETTISSLAKGTLLHIRDLRASWTKEKLHRLRKQLEKFVIDPKRSFGVTLKCDAYSDDKTLNGPIKNKIFDELAFRTTSLRSSIAPDGKHIEIALLHDGQTIFTMRERNPFDRLRNIRITIFYLNQPAKAYFKVQTGYRNVEYGSIFLFLNGFRVLPYGSRSDDWLGLDRRKAQGQRRFLGTRELVGFIEIIDNDDEFKAVSSREGLVNNASFRQLASPHQEVNSSLDDQKIFGYFHKVFRKLERFVVDGLDWDRIKDSASEEDLLSAENVKFDTTRQNVTKHLDGIISLHSPQQYIEDLEVEFKNVFEIAKEEETAYLELVETLQDKFQGTTVANITPAEKRNLSKFVATQAKKLAAKEESSKRLEKQLEVETKRRLFAEFENSSDVEQLLKMNHQTRLLAGKLFKSLNATISKHRSAPDKTSVDALVQIIEKAVFDVDKIRKITSFASKASFNLATNQVTEDLLLFIEEYTSRIQELSGDWNLRVEFENEKSASLNCRFRPLEVMMLVDNLIDNAGKARAKRLTISIIANKDTTRIRFSNDGTSLSSEFSNADLFEKGVTTTSGSGIGLFHVRQIVTDLGGSVSIRNNSTAGVSVNLEFPNK